MTKFRSSIVTSATLMALCALTMPSNAQGTIFKSEAGLQIGVPMFASGTPTPYTANPIVPLPSPVIAGMDAATYPRVNGSTATIPLGQLLASHILGVPAELRRLFDAEIGFRASEEDNGARLTFPLNTDSEQARELLRLLRYKAAHNTTNGAYTALVDGHSDLILVAREPSPDELSAAKAKQVSFDVRPVALDGLVFLVNAENPLQNLTLDQVRGIYTGTISNWKELGGTDFRVQAFTRNRNSGSEELMNKLVMKGQPTIRGVDNMLMGMGMPIAGVSRNQRAIAYSVFYYATFMNPQPTNKLLSIDGIAPTTATLASRQYPLTEPVYVVVRKNAASDSPTLKLRDWLLSPEGQKLVAASGYVPIS